MRSSFAGRWLGLAMLLPLLAGAAFPAFAGDDAPDRDGAFLAALQQAVADDDRDAVSGMIAYPLRTTHFTVKTAAQFLKNYDRILNAGVKQAIADQDASNLFYRDQGVMIGNGQVWFDSFCADGTEQGDCTDPDDRIISFNN